MAGGAVTAPPTVAELDLLIHEPARLRVLALLAMVEEADFMFLLRSTGLSRGNLSVQLRRLEEAELVRLERQLFDGRARTSYALTTTGLTSLRTYKRAIASLLAAIPD
ncbi:MAG: transcriptional regulator [Alphaproteobacteria bacterium]|nr:transcriptional regulator [Alphaproteobacteria bacterium]